RWTDAVNPWPVRCGAALKAPSLELEPDDDADRLDLTGMKAWAIDNPWSLDPDDAVSFDEGCVWVHVADPASAIIPGSPPDLEAVDRAATLYLPEGSIPMLPDEALERFGLGLSVKSRSLSVRITLDPAGAILEAEIVPAFIHATRLSYAAADSFLDEGALSELARIAGMRRAWRMAARAVDIDIPEVRVWLDGSEPRVDPIQESRSAGVVREMMILAGEAAARWAFDRSLPFPYYSQETPQESSSLPAGLAGEFAKRRLMKAGIAGPQPRAHCGLGVPFYAQFTSPLRRYPDLLAHQQARAWLARRDPLPADEISARLGRAAAASGRLRQAERASQLHWTLARLGREPGWTGEGIVVAFGNGPATVYIPSLGLETKLRLDRAELNAVVPLRLSGVDIPRQESRFDVLSAR
ncbi:MAG TPA: RNB domain-containing ribonuclease, partial [Magnetospirillaceae bacterium]|nr:RNB domain-containing ribonuclease [Magnetospirillaceae bacterium]